MFPLQNYLYTKCSISKAILQCHHATHICKHVEKLTFWTFFTAKKLNSVNITEFDVLATKNHFPRTRTVNICRFLCKKKTSIKLWLRLLFVSIIKKKIIYTMT